MTAVRESMIVELVDSSDNRHTIVKLKNLLEEFAEHCESSAAISFDAWLVSKLIEKQHGDYLRSSLKRACD